MRKTLLVLKTEIINTFTRRSFLFLTFGLPIVGFLLFTIVSNLNERSKESIESIISAPAPSQEAEGYVDYSGVIQSLPSNIEEGRLIAYATEEEALQALANGEVSAFYIIPKDVIDRGEIILVKPNFSPLSPDSEDRVIHWTFKVNLLE